jgi:hypothetical protein
MSLLNASAEYIESLYATIRASRLSCLNIETMPDLRGFGETEFTMNTYVAVIGGKAILTFRAVDDDQAHAMIDNQEGSMRSDLKVLLDADGKPLWDGKSAIQVREATGAEHAEWQRSRDQAISDGEIDLDARDDPDNWNVYLMGAPKNKVRRNK